MTFTERAGTSLARLLAAITLMAAGGVAGAATSTVADALTAGEAHVALRYRFERVDQDNFAERANASTLRLRLNYTTGAWRELRMLAEFDYVGEVLANDFNSGAGTSPGRIQYPVVADPKGADLNQLYADYSGLSGWRWRLGRQRILIDDHRFVGNVGWRQNEQTYDALSVTTSRLPRTELFYGFVTNVNRVFGDTVPDGDHSMDTHLLHARINLSKRLSVTPYGFFIDNHDDPTASTSTIGVRLGLSHSLAGGTLSYLADAARQVDAANAPVDFEADYLRFDLSWTGPSGLSLSVSAESLGGDDTISGGAFRTPFATLHAFQGWADQFLVTPDAGVNDLQAKLGYARGQWQWQAAFHDFSAETGGADYGTELDFSVSRNFGERYAVMLKTAIFNADEPPFVDTNKYWLMLTADY
ncbi:MAG TPA: alginate export family protein [Woeseiaceae bacterium]|nr:alginate export family protein [Woeseiaceae bacterium]